MTIATGTDDSGRMWTAVYCNGCGTSVDREGASVDDIIRDHGWSGEYCPACLDGAPVRASLWGLADD